MDERIALDAKTWHMPFGALHGMCHVCALTFFALQADKDAREDRLQRDPDYDSHLGIERDPITREITHVAAST